MKIVPHEYPKDNRNTRKINANSIVIIISLQDVHHINAAQPFKMCNILHKSTESSTLTNNVRVIRNSTTLRDI